MSDAPTYSKCAEVHLPSEYFPHCATSVRVFRSTDGAVHILSLSTGAAGLQTYVTSNELRELGEMLLRQANDNEVLEVAAG